MSSSARSRSPPSPTQGFWRKKFLQNPSPSPNCYRKNLAKMLLVLAPDMLFSCGDWATSQGEEKLRTRGGVCKVLSCQKSLGMLLLLVFKPCIVFMTVWGTCFPFFGWKKILQCSISIIGCNVHVHVHPCIMHLSMLSPREGTPSICGAFDFSEEFLVQNPTVGPQNLVKSDQISPT